MSEQINYEERLPRQPSEGALDWCIQTKFKSEYAIYRDTYYRDPLTGMRENAVSVTCTACGDSWIAEKVRGADCRIGRQMLVGGTSLHNLILSIHQSQ